MTKVKKYLLSLFCRSNRKVPLDRLGPIGFMIQELYSKEMKCKIAQFSPKWRWVVKLGFTLFKKMKRYSKVRLVAEKLAGKTELERSAIYYHYKISGQEVRMTLLPRIFRYCRYADGDYSKRGSRAERWLTFLSC